MNTWRSAAGASIAVALSCASQRPPPNAPPALAHGWSFEVRVAPGGRELDVDGVFPPGSTTFEIESDARFVRDVEVRRGARRTAVEPSGDHWNISTCASGCEVSYVYDLARAADTSRDGWIAERLGAAISSPPSAWLLHPSVGAQSTPFRLHVTSAPGEAFATGLSAVAGAADTYEGRAEQGFDTPFAVFGRFRRVSMSGGHVEVAFLDAFRDERAVLDWVDRSARVVQAFYGGPPVPRVLLLLSASEGDGVGSGTTMGSSGASIRIDVGKDATTDSLRRDWVLIHEMIHTALPNVSRDHHWFEEGLATYVEPVARVQAGLRTPESVWAEWASGMPQGLPEEGDEGLDRTHTWGRTYWGGALFCLVADVALREQTNNKYSLQTALREVLRRGGNIEVDWPMERVLDAADAGTDRHVLRETYEHMATHPYPVDLEALWRKLGVKVEGKAVTFDDGAPLAYVRKGITPAPNEPAAARP